jgi:hypothetical protein
MEKQMSEVNCQKSTQNVLDRVDTHHCWSDPDMYDPDSHQWGECEHCDRVVSDLLLHQAEEQKADFMNLDGEEHALFFGQGDAERGERECAEQIHGYENRSKNPWAYMTDREIDCALENSIWSDDFISSAN